MRSFLKIRTFQFNKIYKKLFCQNINDYLIKDCYKKFEKNIKIYMYKYLKKI